MASNKFEIDIFNSMKNSNYGKTMENIRNRVDIKLATNKEKLLKYVSKPSFISSKIINENLVAIQKLKVDLYMLEFVYWI